MGGKELIKFLERNIFFPTLPTVPTLISYNDFLLEKMFPNSIFGHFLF